MGNDTENRETGAVVQNISMQGKDCALCNSIPMSQMSERVTCALDCGERLKFPFSLSLGESTSMHEYIGITEIRLERTTGPKSLTYKYRYVVKNIRPLTLWFHDREPDTYCLVCLI